MNRANALFDETFPQIQAQTYEGYGAVELMVSVLLRQAQMTTRGSLLLYHALASC
jgi:hypothetical protein